MAANYSWLFVDGESQETFRIRSGDPVWQTGDDGSFEQARCNFDIVAEDGTGFKFSLRITGGVLESQGVDSTAGLMFGLGYDFAPQNKMSLFASATYSLAKYDDQMLLGDRDLELKVGGFAGEIGVKFFLGQ
mgnify:CR=1 FL=1